MTSAAESLMTFVPTQFKWMNTDSGVLYQNTLSTIACPEQNENFLPHPEEGHSGPQGTVDSISVLTVHCSCGTIVDDGKPLMPCLNCGK